MLAIVLVILVLTLPETTRSVTGNGSIAPPNLSRPLLPNVRRSWQKEPPDRPTMLYKNEGFPNLLKALIILFRQTRPLSCLVSISISGKLIDRDYRIVARKHSLPIDTVGGDDLSRFPIEEARLRSVFVPTFLAMASMIGYGWAVHYHTAVLAKYKIPEGGIWFAYRVNYGIDADDRYLTLVLLSSYEHGCQDQWVQAVKEIRRELVQAGIYWAIELIDERVFYRSLHTSPILSTDRDLIEGWSKVLPDFHTMIENRNWVSVDVFHREFPSREMQPTVIISARDANDDNSWDTTLPALHQLLQANNLKVDIVLLFLQDLKFTTTESAIAEGRTTPSSAITEGYVEPDPFISKEFYMDTISMGSSCATSSSTRSGTLGGRIMLQKESSIIELGLTNYHVLGDAFIGQTPSAGPFPPDLGQSYENAVSPSDRDHETAIQSMRDSLQKAEERYKDLSEKVEYLTENDPGWGRISQHTKIASQKQELLVNELELAETSSRHIGQIYAASGFRKCENRRFLKLMQHKDWALDWCLVKVDQQKSISNRLQGVPSTAHYVRNRAEVTQYCSISAMQHYEVIKRGRTTGWTKGTLNAIDSTLRMQDYPLPIRKLPTIQGVAFKKKWGGTKKFLQFLQPGDAGSLILLDQALNTPGVSIVGLGFAANDDSYASYMIPMDLVIEDIERVTGAKVIEPRNAGKA
ncbi:hypothetical protein BDV96DRAFT_601106 [Lophiotrema nucula]|uniref:Uncharacterized protein n=1 Tax=Lophiotrema nucula TaxID=690887 RepID=A0A6A5Z2J0_9PLEO|nr:hypothetical protein BDV96DRAFT_601106 [Lophiotrema nucula]